MDTWEQFFMPKFNKVGLAINEQHTDPNDILLKLAIHKRYASTGEGCRILQIMQVAVVK
jgi:hypothetical protein